MFRRVASLAALTLAVAQPPIRDTTFGPVSGTVVDGNVAVWHSIPFAKPPVGNLRFKAPEWPEKWTDVLDASGQPQACPQLKLDGDVFLGSEDCLYLHVYVPLDALAANGGSLPVMFWIFGGGYVLGDAIEFGWYDGSNLAREKGVIVVAPNYRVGPFGFTALKELQATDPGKSTGNAGLQDQTLALRWVQDNIAAFGGNPNKVTIFGESAGGFSVCWHMVSKASAGLFHGAIMESGSCDSPQFFQTLPDAIGFSNLYAMSVGCNAETLSGPALVECVQAVSANDMQKSLLDMIFDANWPFTSRRLRGGTPDDETKEVRAMRQNLTQYAVDAGLPPHTVLPALAPLMPWGPAVDGSSAGLLDVPIDLIRAGQFNNVPMIMGTNLNEGTIFVPMMPLVARGTCFPPSDSEIPVILAHALNMYTNTTLVDELVSLVMDNYPPYAWDNNWARTSDIMTHFFFTCAARRTARALSEHEANVFLYQFSYETTFLESILLGDYHTSELDFVFNNQWPWPFHLFLGDDQAMSDAFTSFWTNFAYSGSPNEGPSQVQVQWPQYTTQTDTNMQMKIPLGTTQGLDNKLCNMWDEIAAKLDAAGGELRSFPNLHLRFPKA